METEQPHGSRSPSLVLCSLSFLLSIGLFRASTSLHYKQSQWKEKDKGHNPKKREEWMKWAVFSLCVLFNYKRNEISAWIEQRQRQNTRLIHSRFSFSFLCPFSMKCNAMEGKREKGKEKWKEEGMSGVLFSFLCFVHFMLPFHYIINEQRQRTRTKTPHEESNVV